MRDFEDSPTGRTSRSARGLTGVLREQVREAPAVALGAVLSLAALAAAQLGLTWVVRAWIAGPLARPDAPLARLMAGAAACLVVGAGAVWLSRWLLARVTHGVAARLRAQVAVRLVRREITAAALTHGGDLAARVTADAEYVGQGLASVAQRVVREGLVLVGAVVLMLVVAWPLVIVVALCGPPLAWLLVRAGRTIRIRSTESRRAVGDVGQAIAEQHDGLVTIKTLQTESEESARVLAAIERARAAAVDADWHASVALAVAFLLTGASLLGVMTVAARLLGSSLDGLSLVTFLLLVAQVIEPTRRLAEVHTEVARMDGAWRRLDSLRDAPIEPVDATTVGSLPDLDVPGVSADWAVEALAIRIPGQDGPLLDNLTWLIPTGAHLALVGASGAGKSTLLTALIGAVPIDQGVLTVCGHRVGLSSLRQVRRVTCLVPHVPLLVAGSLRDNIAYGTLGATENEVVSVARLCGLSRLMDSHPDGLDQQVHGAGRQVSAGERQRLAIARAVLRDPHLLLLDEATSALDGAQEAALFEALAPWMSRRTVVVVTHRLSTARRMPRVALLHEGRLLMGSWPEMEQHSTALAALFAGQHASDAAGTRAPSGS